MYHEPISSEPIIINKTLKPEGSFANILADEMKKYLACVVNPFIGRKIYSYARRKKALKHRGCKNRQSRNLLKLLFNETHMHFRETANIRQGSQQNNEAQA